jgi:hypothetical protein
MYRHLSSGQSRIPDPSFVPGGLELNPSNATNHLLCFSISLVDTAYQFLSIAMTFLDPDETWVFLEGLIRSESRNSFWIFKCPHKIAELNIFVPLWFRLHSQNFAVLIQNLCLYIYIYIYIYIYQFQQTRFTHSCGYCHTQLKKRWLIDSCSP